MSPSTTQETQRGHFGGPSSFQEGLSRHWTDPTAMRVLLGCEESATCRTAFEKRGHYAVSCDMMDTRVPGRHYKGNIFDIINDGWDLAIFFPPCTRLTVAGARWFKGKEKEQAEAIEFVERLWDANIPRIAIENPIGVLSTRSTLGKPTQIIQPWMFGHPETKSTCLWLKGLPKLVETNNVYDEMLKLPKNQRHRIHMMPPGPDRAKERSKTFQGIAEAMGKQWG